jgi:hypothetical protein
MLLGHELNEPSQIAKTAAIGGLETIKPETLHPIFQTRRNSGS